MSREKIERGEHPAYGAWRRDSAGREEDAAWLFGAYLIRHCRAEALKSLDADASEATSKAVESAVDIALHNVMDLLEGYWPLAADRDMRAEFALHVNVFHGDAMVEQQVIAPGKVDLPIGYWSWIEAAAGD